MSFAPDRLDFFWKEDGVKSEKYIPVYMKGQKKV